jgi:hypothetical protein
MFGWMWNAVRSHLIEPFLDADPADRRALILKWVLVIGLIGVIMTAVPALRFFLPF